MRPVTLQTPFATQPATFAAPSYASATPDQSAELTRMMADHLLRVRPDTASEALQKLRQAFPASPLAARVAALTASMNR